MPIRPNPFTLSCPACGWKKTVAPQSDCLGPGDWFSCCPRCQHAPLERKPAGAVAAMLAQVSQHYFMRKWR